MNSAFKATVILFLLLASACAPAPMTATADILASVVAATLTAAAGQVTAIPISTQTPAATATPSPEFVLTIADNVNLRTGPGTLFTVSRVMKRSTRLRVLGLAPGSELQAAWLSVRNDEGINGWVDGRLVSDWSNLFLSVVEPQGVQLVRGRVQDRSGQPVSGAGFAIYQGSGNGPNARRTDVSTDRTGYFYAYLPLTATGVWTVEYVSIACPSSVLDSNCDCLDPGACGPAEPKSRSITLPWSETLTYTWQ